MCCWSVVSACSGAVQNYQGMICLRFCLGFVEAPLFPGSLFLFSSWYTKKELAKRIFILYAAGQMAGAFGGLLGSAIMGGMDGKAGLAAWRWLYEFTFMHGWRLTEQEKHLAILRIAEDANEQDVHKSGSREGLELALTDPSLYILWFMQLSLNTAAAFTNFFPTIVKTLGYNKTQTLLLSASPYVFAAILGITNSWHSDKTRERWLHVIWPQVFCSIGFIISAVTLNVAARYTAIFMMMSVYGGFWYILSWVSPTLPRPSSKRAVAYAIVNAGSNLASIYASYIYPSSQGPRYWQANVVNVAFSAACIALATALRLYLGWRNKKLEQAIIDDEIIEGSAVGARVTALADRWQCYPDYRYTL
ncbi:MFS transporter [Aureobasidium sp. EXF-12298]|nr:MFS transporter [Aureobasidium sp. EXF-12298]KAI4766595.1 MFS transporter [Aureobasidium sp. EXF-12344]KAI4776622.1 MFS transporter [Aureobasidium sp. EXF-3400]